MKIMMIVSYLIGVMIRLFVVVYELLSDWLDRREQPQTATG